MWSDICYILDTLPAVYTKIQELILITPDDSEGGLDIESKTAT